MESNNYLHFPISNTLEPYTKEQYPESKSVGSILVGGFIRVISTAAYGIGFILDVVLSPFINLASCLNVLKKPTPRNRKLAVKIHNPLKQQPQKTSKVTQIAIDPSKLKSEKGLSKKNPTQKTQATRVIPSLIKSTGSSLIEDSIEKIIDEKPEEERKHSSQTKENSGNFESMNNKTTPNTNTPHLKQPELTPLPVNSRKLVEAENNAQTPQDSIEKTIDQDPEPVKEEGKHSDTQEKPSDNRESTKAETTSIKNPATSPLQGTKNPPIVIDATENPIDEGPENTPQPNSTFRTALKVFAVSAFIGVGVYAYYQNSSSQESSITEDSTSRIITSQSSNLLRTVVQNRFLSFIPGLWSSFSQIPEHLNTFSPTTNRTFIDPAEQNTTDKSLSTASSLIGPSVQNTTDKSLSTASSLIDPSVQNTTDKSLSTASSLIDPSVQNTTDKSLSTASSLVERVAEKAKSKELEFHNAMHMPRSNVLDLYANAVSLINKALKQNGDLKAVENRILYNMKIMKCGIFSNPKEPCFEKVRQEIQQDTDTIASYLSPKGVDMCLPRRDINKASFISSIGKGTPYSIQKLLTQENGRYRNALHFISRGMAANLTAFNTGTVLPLLKTVFDKAGLDWN